MGISRPADDELEIVAGFRDGILGFFVTQLEDVRIVDSDESIAHTKSGLFRQTASVHLKPFSNN